MGFIFKIATKALDGQSPSTVVLYDSSERQVYGYRIGWLMRALKIVPESINVKILDGGFQKWTKEKREVESCSESELHNIKRDDADIPEFKGFELDRIKFLKEIQVYETASFQGRSLFKLLDSRPKSDVAGGTVDGITNITFSDYFDVSPDGIKTLKPKDERREMLQKHDISPGKVESKELVVMCRTGVTATVLLGALSDLYEEFGYEKLSIYDGSWLEYSTHIVESTKLTAAL